MDRKRKLGLAAFLTVFVSAAILLSLPPKTGPEVALPTFQLSDGRTIYVEAVSFGRSHELRNGSEFTERVQKWLPRPIRGLLGPELVKIRTTTSEDTLIPFLSIEKNPGGKSPQWGGWHVVSENGQDFDSGSWSSGRSWNGRSLAYPRLPVFPRREASFMITGTVDRLPFAITIPNPVLTKTYPTWTPRPPGVTNSQDGYEFVLGNTDIYTNRNSYTPRTSLTIYKDGKQVNNWFRYGVEYEDATGNRGYRIPTNEPAWKIDFTVRREYPAPWHPGEYHDIQLGDLPGDAEHRDLGSGLTINGENIRQMWLGGSGEFTMANGSITNALPWGATGRRGTSTSSSGSGNWKMEWGRDKPWLMFEMSSLPKNVTVSVFLVDAEGRHSTANWRGSMSSGSFRVRYFELKPPEEARPPFTARIAVQTNINTHFIVDPAKLKRTGPRPRKKR